MFRGISSVNLDAKGRMALPVRFRDVWEGCGGRVVVTIDPVEPCLLLYPLPAWETVQDNLQARANVRKPARIVQRLLIGHATDIEADGSGRILLPPPLREHAQLNKKLVLLGNGKKVEIWAEEVWHTRRDELKNEVSKLDLDGDDLAGLTV